MKTGNRSDGNRTVMRQWAAGQGGYIARLMPMIYDHLKVASAARAAIRKIDREWGQLKDEVTIDFRTCEATRHPENLERMEYLEMMMNNHQIELKKALTSIAGMMIAAHDDGWI